MYGYGISKYLDLDISHENFSLKNFSPFVHNNNIFKIIDEINDVIYNVSRNANTKLLFLDLSFYISKLNKKKYIMKKKFSYIIILITLGFFF